ncbi:hypothetical protein MVEN_00789500 [Mycena venus]|uniref:Mucoidy inhibitor A n=1 Tax=Mycena venus TaxID=2733690 RepID=A0A8H7D5Z6_9AGAR|nr:hypothetical protein MVEN_00789500 [Mycena venus]
MTSTDPPAFEPTSIELQSAGDSKIVSVSLYPTHAEITRLYKFAVQIGQNQVNISGLPNVLQAESLRVEGRGAATIHDVTMSMADEHVPKSSPKLEELLSTRETAANALTRCEEALSSVRQYLGSVTVQNLAVSQLESILEQYETTGARLDARKAELTRELKRIDNEIVEERVQIQIPPEKDKLRNMAAIGVFAQAAGDVEIALIYAVPLASWTAFYDIRVNMDTKESPVKLIYKAAVKQNTGESWDNVSLQLETSTPTFGLGVPKLSPHGLSIYTDRLRLMVTHGWLQRVGLSGPLPCRGELGLDQVLEMAHEGAAVMATGTVSATFSVPGLVTIPCDGATHNFTIVELRPKATMSWVAVPKRERKTHLTAHITNASEYTLLTGTANVYVDGSFIACSSVPHVSPKESFDCPLGLDPSIRITYPAMIKKLSQSGFYKKSATHSFAQRITVHNTKSVPVEGLRIVDQIPASRNEQIKVKLVQPALPLGESEGTAGPKAANAKGSSVTVTNGVVAQWDGGDERDRRVSWVCTVPAQGKITLALEWTVTISPADARVVGM